MGLLKAKSKIEALRSAYPRLQRPKPLPQLILVGRRSLFSRWFSK